MELKNRTVLITGANRGIGRALVEALLKKGVNRIYAGARRPESLPDFGDDRVVPLQLDIRSEEQVSAAADRAGDVDLLINNAGTAAFANLLSAPVQTLREDVETNYFGTLSVLRAFVPVLEKAGGAAIVNLTTIASFVNFPQLGGYSASKAALFSASQGIRIELAPKGIAVHTVNPGPIDTDMAKDLPMDKTSPQDAARNIIAGLEADVADILPDPASEQMFDVWKGDYRALEQMVGELYHGG